jgi:hypothetical protein
MTPSIKIILPYNQENASRVTTQVLRWQLFTVLAWDQSQDTHVELLANELVKSKSVSRISSWSQFHPYFIILCDIQQPSLLPQPHSLVRYTFDSALNKENLELRKTLLMCYSPIS